MDHRFRYLIVGAAVGATLSAAPLARAQDGGAPDAAPLLDAGPDSSVSPGAILAYYCGGADLECTIAGPLEYAKTIQLPFAFDWDTNWIPNGSPLQVRFYVKMPAETTVELDGQLQTTWPQAMTLATPGGSRGFLGFDYGLEVGAKARIDANVAGIPIKWSGDIPYVPQVDFHMQGATLFTPWAFAPNGAKASAFTKEFTLFDVNLLGLAGVPSQISKGGVSLDVKGELSATYTTDRIQIDPAGTNELSVQSASGTAYRAFPGGAFVEYNVWPEGTVHYDGTLHLIPAFYLEVLGKKFSIPITDFPLTMPIGDQAFVFDPVRVHVPLPDIEELKDPMIDFGQVAIGGGKLRKLPLSNIGEAKARATGFIDAAMQTTFKLTSPSTLIDSGQGGSVTIRFTPQKAGLFETEMTLVTNDPDYRFIKVKLRGLGAAVSGPDYPADDAGAPEAGAPGAKPSANESGGCGCRSAGSGEAPPGGLWFGFVGVGLLLSRHRRRRA